MSIQGDNIIAFPGRPRDGALLLRVDLVLAPYPVWRRLRVTEHATFWDLHVAIQDAMGWSHRHRHLFTADHPRTGDRLRLGIPEDGAYHGRQTVLPSWQFRVREVVRPDYPPFLYTYHLGEEWQHEVSLVGHEAAPEAGPAPACLDGAGACPPEGHGGPEVFGVRFAAGPAAWPEGFDPEAFDPRAVVFCDPRLLWRDYFDAD